MARVFVFIILLPALFGCKEQAVPEPGWISAVDTWDSIPPLRPAPYFRKEFRVEEPVDSARLKITGLGYFQAYINGRRVGDHHLDPAVTMYHKRVKYLEFDVSDMVKEGRNATGAVLGNGFYNQHTKSSWSFEKAPWRDAPCLCVLLTIYLESGKEMHIISDSSWKRGESPIRFDGIRNGEFYDARYEIPGWSEPGFPDDRWSQAFEVDGPEGFLSRQLMPPIRVVDTLYPQRIEDLGNGVFLLDFGQNISGWGRISVRAERGREIRLRYGEVLDKDGKLDTREISRFIKSGETQTDQYICSGRGPETWEPTFVYHGFQYIEVSGLPEPPEKNTVTALVAHTDLQQTGSFHTSDRVLNQLQHNMIWSFLTNYHSYPEDCPHREKMGWTGDAQLLAEMALYNFNMKRAYLKWLDDFTDAQLDNGQLPGIVPTSGWGFTFGRDEVYRERGYGPQWEEAFVEIAWQLYKFTGDTTILERYYQNLSDYVNYLESYSEDDLLYFGIDDHKALEPVTRPPILASGHYYRCVDLISRISLVLGQDEDQRRYKSLGRDIFSAFNKTYVDTVTGLVGRGSQTEQALALYFDLVPEDHRAVVYERLMEALEKTDWHLHTGVLGTKYVINVLPQFGDQELLYRIITDPEYPGYGYWVSQGATTMWQTWPGDMSRNHIMFGSLGEWYYKYLAGIIPDEREPGFRHIYLKPLIPDDLEGFRCGVSSGSGEIRVESHLAGSSREVLISLPENTTATLLLDHMESPAVTEQASGKVIHPGIGVTDGGGLNLDPGSYRVVYTQ